MFTLLLDVFSICRGREVDIRYAFFVGCADEMMFRYCRSEVALVVDDDPECLAFGGGIDLSGLTGYREMGQRLHGC